MPGIRVDARGSEVLIGVGMGEGYDGCVDKLLSGVFEVHRHAMAVDRLNLADAPIGAVRMGNEIPWCQGCRAA